MASASVTGVNSDTSDNKEPAPSSSVIANTVFIRSVSLTGIFLILLLFAIKYAAPILIPITLAYILSLLLAPIVRRMRKARVPDPVGAALVLIGFLMITAIGIYGLSAPAEEWSGRVPELMEKLDNRLRPLSEPLRQARDAAEQVSKITDAEPDQSLTSVTVSVENDSWLTELLSGTPRMLANVGIVIVLMYFLLAGGDSFLNKLVRVIPKLEDKKRAVTIMRDIQSDISHYLLTCTIINIVLGTVAATVLYFLDMPNPVLWGALVGLLNFAPYIGPACSLVIITLASLLSFDSIGQAMIPPLTVFSLNILEGQLITPQIIGRRLALSPVVVFTGIVVWGWLWGIAGALMAIPIIAAINVVCQKIEPLSPVADFIGASERSN